MTVIFVTGPTSLSCHGPTLSIITLRSKNREMNCLIAVDGGWSEWSAKWSECSRSCGGGVQSRFRLCNSPSPSDGGKDCPGEHFETLDCNPEPCKSENLQCSVNTPICRSSAWTLV